MNRVPKRIAACILSGMLLCQPTAIDVPNGSVIVAEAHSGRTDSSGGHHDNKNKSGLGSYHYHCGGYPAHLHDGGVCPYSATAASVSDETVSSSNQDGAASNSSSGGSDGAMLSSGESITVSKDMIKIIQDVLNQKGYDCGTVDGMAGTKTKESLKKFLEEHADSDDTDHMILSILAEGLGIE